MTRIERETDWPPPPELPRCPKCSALLQWQTVDGPGLRFFCSECGWVLAKPERPRVNLDGCAAGLNQLFIETLGSRKERTYIGRSFLLQLIQAVDEARAARQAKEAHS